MKSGIFVSLFLMIVTASAISQPVKQVDASGKWREKVWDATWIGPGNPSPTDYEVYRFRKTFMLDQVPETFVINISADPRYELFVNGVSVCRGPARGSLIEWYYETINIAGFLRKGENVLAVSVWNYGRWSAGAQASLHTGLIIQGEGETESVANTNDTWKSMNDLSLSPSTVYLQDVGPGVIVKGALFPWGWESTGFDDSGWAGVSLNRKGEPAWSTSHPFRALVPRPIPLMEDKPESAPVIRRSEGVTTSNNFREGKPIRIPAHTKAKILLDQEYLTNAYLTLNVSGGEAAKLSLTYSEAMFATDREKGNRNDIEGKYIRGYVDTFYPEGSASKNYSPLWFRCYRYIQIDVETAADPLTINSLKARFTGYPFKDNGSFACNDPLFDKIWTVGWRTARLCAGETYYDCPYYEQLQYAGDTRIQCLVSLYVSGDDRLMRRAINDFAGSVTPEGILRSRYPAKVDQIIPAFSLYWINTLHDYWMHRADEEFVRSYLPVLKSILNWYERKIDPATGMLGAMPYWNFTDWPKAWPWTTYEPPTGGVPPGGKSGGSSIMTLQLAYTLGDAVEILDYFGEKALAVKYKRIKNDLCRSTVEKCFDPGRKLFADDIAHTSYSQHASIMGILSGAVKENEQQTVFDALVSDRTLVPATVYYEFYLVKAMICSGLADRYTSSLGTWKEMISMGLTTFAEEPEPARSDCHAWSASPNYYLLSAVCGVTPDSPGFKSVLIEPHLGSLKYIKGVVPHPAGNIKVEIRANGGKTSGTVILPAGLTGKYRHGKKETLLKPGSNSI